MDIYIFGISMEDSIMHWPSLFMEEWIFDTSQRSLVSQPGGVLIAVYIRDIPACSRPPIFIFILFS